MKNTGRVKIYVLVGLRVFPPTPGSFGACPANGCACGGPLDGLGASKSRTPLLILFVLATIVFLSALSIDFCIYPYFSGFLPII